MATGDMARGRCNKKWRLGLSAIAHLAAASIAFLFSFFQFGILMVAFFYAWFFVLAVGILLVLARLGFFALIPTLLQYSVPIVDLINVCLVLFTLLEDAVITLIDAVVIVVDAVSALMGDDDPPLSLIEYEDFTTITYSEFEEDLRLIATECTPIDSTVDIADQWLPALLDETLCPVFRSVYALPYNIGPRLYQTFGGGWVSDPTPWPMGNNCDRVVTTRHGILCGSLAVGYPVLEVIFPSVILGIFILSSGSQLSSLVAWIMTTTTRLVGSTACSVTSALRSVNLFAKFICRPPW